MLTDLEFYELRYSGKAASFVRGFRAIYLGLFFNCVIIATVNLAAVKIAVILFGWPRFETLLILAAVPIVFAATAGLWGVMVTDLIQFVITITAAFAAAYFAIHAPGVGGLHGLISHVNATHPSMLALVPNFSDWPTALAIFVIPLTVQWWSVWYPGSEPGGGSYVAQRMLAARTESDAAFGTLTFAAMHYALRPWPWIIVALASTIVYPSLHDIAVRFPNVPANLIGNDIAYPAMLVFLPAGFAGFMVAGLFAAYRSTIETHLNWGTSYLVHDFFQRFVRPGATQRELVLTGRLVTVGLMAAGVAFSLFLDNAKSAFDLLLSIGAGTGLIYLLRWFWWRINAWSEVSAMASSFAISLGFFVARKIRPYSAGYVDFTLDRRRYHGRLASGHVPYRTGPGGDARGLLRQGTPRRPGLASGAASIWITTLTRLSGARAGRLGFRSSSDLRSAVCNRRIHLRPGASGRDLDGRRGVGDYRAVLGRRTALDVQNAQFRLNSPQIAQVSVAHCGQRRPKFAICPTSGLAFRTHKEKLF